MAQWNPGIGNIITNDDIGIGITAPSVPNSKLSIISGFNITGGAIWNVPYNPPLLVLEKQIKFLKTK